MIKETNRYFSSELVGDRDEEYWDIVSWEILQGELGVLQIQGKITNLRFRRDKGSGFFVVRYMPTDKLEWPDLFNMIEDYIPDKYEERRKWIPWGETSS